MARITTTNRGYSTPDLDEPDNVPADLKALADAVDLDMKKALAGPTDSGWVDLTGLLNGWTAVTGYPLQLRRIGKQRFVRGMANPGTSGFGKAIVTLPAGDFDASGPLWLTASVNATGSVAQLNLQPNGGLMFISTYVTPSSNTTGSWPVVGTWMVP